MDDFEEILDSSDLETRDSENLPNATAHIERKHNNEGYLAAVTVTKQGYLQHGFNYGYDHGAQMGLAVGYLLSVIQSGNRIENLKRQTNSTHHDWDKIYNTEATNELSSKSLFSNEFYETNTTELPRPLYKRLENPNENPRISDINEFLESSFPAVPSDHPTVKKWANQISKDLNI